MYCAYHENRAKHFIVIYRSVVELNHVSSPVSSIYIWSENLVAESEAKDGGN